MLLTLLLWMAMGLTAYVVGIGFVPPQAVARTGDRHLAAVWVGYVVVSNAWVALALVTPLTFGLVMGVTALGVAGLWLYRQRQSAWVWLPSIQFREMPPLLWVAGIGVLCGLAWLSAQTVKLFDTGLYHYQIVQWLKTYGIVPGVALVYFQLGYVSSWFGFVAPFEVGWWYHRLGAVGGFFPALLWLHGWLALWRAQCEKAHVADWFMLLAGSLLLLMAVHLNHLASLAVDVPTAALIVATVWSMLCTHDRWCKNPAEEELSPWAISIPVLLAGGALSIKLSAAPIAAITTGWALWQLYCRQSAAARGLVLFVPVGAMFLLLIPTTLGRWVSSGYPFFPSGFPSSSFRWFLPDWAYDPHRLSVAIHAVRDFARWAWWQSPETPRHSQSWMDIRWLPNWLENEAFMPLYLGLAVAAGIGLRGHPASKINALYPWVMVLVWSGLVYVFVTAPTLRFAMGFLVILPALWQAEVIRQATWRKIAAVSGLVMATTMGGVFYQRPLDRTSLILLVATATVGWSLAVWAYQRSRLWGGAAMALLLCLPAAPISILRNRSRLQAQGVMLMPATLPSHPTKVITVNDVPIHIPIPPTPDVKYPLCWGSPLPCSADKGEVDSHLRFRNPERGLAGGFKRRQSLD
ncbi:MAG: LIC_10190 family membrane protein [Acidobacteriota bacterium]